MPQAPSKPLSAFETKLLGNLWEKVKPRVFDAIEQAKAKLRGALGAKLEPIEDALADAQHAALTGEILIPVPVRKALGTIVTLAQWLGLEPTPREEV